MINYKNKQKGFTMVEILIYIGVAIIVLGAIAGVVAMLIQSKDKSQAIAEVEQQGVQIMNTITQSIRNAEAINSPGTGASASSLSLDVVNVGDDPTVFAESSGVLQMTEGATTSNITSSWVTISSLNFQNISRASTPGVIRISFTLTTGGSNKGSFYFSRDFNGSASLR